MSDSVALMIARRRDRALRRRGTRVLVGAPERLGGINELLRRDAEGSLTQKELREMTAEELTVVSISRAGRELAAEARARDEIFHRLLGPETGPPPIHDRYPGRGGW